VLSPASFTVKGGQEYWWQYQVFRSNGTTMRSVTSLYWYNASGALLTTSVLGSFATNTTNGIQTRNGAVTAPTGAVTARWRWTLEASFTDGQVNFASPEVRPKGGAELIVVGAITSTSLATNAVTSDKIAARAYEFCSKQARSIFPSGIGGRPPFGPVLRYCGVIQCQPPRPRHHRIHLGKELFPSRLLLLHRIAQARKGGLLEHGWRSSWGCKSLPDYAEKAGFLVTVPSRMITLTLAVGPFLLQDGF